MEEPSTMGVLGHLGALEDQARKRKTPQQSRLKELKDRVEALRIQRDQLVAEIEIHKKLQHLRSSMDQECTQEDEETGEEKGKDPNSQILHQMAKYSQLKDLLYAHHITGGYNLVKTRQGKGVCISLATAYNGVFFETYNLELNLRPIMTISRHNIPPFIPLKRLEEESDFQTDLTVFLDTLSRHLNAYVGRKEQLRLVKELHPSVEVMESNALCSILVLMFTIPRVKMTVLCTLDYSDHTSCFPKRVSLESEDMSLPESEEWKKNCSLLMKTPVHQALSAMMRMGSIA